ncbi:NAD(P)/FAD-dependent oxidoreductase [Corynebacterium sp.]|uniref:NAD(P)/FAD-dependent oxidoreductase n=1 Tax=Corynebacterium sp. TaxID=1720 RepID=UPI0025BAB54E|nr:NAD(P)/FAD-dependent oxidoreductase [Corynebacterium sp.]
MTQPDHQRIAVIGGGVAAHSALKAFLAAAGDTVGTTSVDVFTREAHRPYRRPSVNKDILIDGKSADEVALPGAVFDGSDSVDVTLHLDSEVTAVDTAARTLTVDGGDVAWDQLILATGASPRRLDAPWLEGREVHYIRTPEHSTALRESLTALSADDNVVVIGGGILGLEAAAGASTLTDATVTVLEAQDDICRRIMPAAAAAWLREKHTAHGIDIRCGLSDAEISDTLADLDPAVTVVSVGLDRDVSLARSAGLQVNRGIVTDEFGRTSVPGVWAAGDCVEIHAEDGTVTLPEDEGSARLLGGIVGLSIAGQETDRFLLSPPKGWSRQFGAMLNLAGATGRPVQSGQPGPSSNPADHELVLVSEEDELVVFSLESRSGGESVVSGVTTAGRSPLVRKAKNALGMTLEEVESEFFTDGALIPTTT